jgi:hypothetical protein
MVEVEGGRQAVEARMDTFCQSPIRSRVGVEVEVEVDEGEEVSEEFIRAAVMLTEGGRGKRGGGGRMCVCVGDREIFNLFLYHFV